ncbi:MAG: hypothetical protein V2B18_04345 [Pseudomonadota bacterium]
MAGSKLDIVRLPLNGSSSGPKRIIEERGELVVLRPEGPVYNPVYFDIHPGVGRFRGSHYHVEKTEYFYVISGSCRIRHVDLETMENGFVIAVQGDMVTVAPHCAHILEAVEHCRVMEYSSTVVDYGKDTIPYKFD